MLCALAALSAGACKDAPTDPMVGVVAEESAAALSLDVSFADPEALLHDGQAMGEAGLSALSRWHESWLLEVDEGHAERQALYPTLVDALARTARPEDVALEVDRFGNGLRKAAEIPADGLPERLAAGLDAARERHEQAVVALARNDLRTAISEIVRGGDALREVGPEAVARSLQQDVSDAFGRISSRDAYSEQDYERLERLVHGSREAIERGEWVLAIRRAYYARALLAGR